MGFQQRLRDTETDLHIVLPGADALIYEEALSGATWYSAGISVNLPGPMDTIGARARRIAGMYARLYRQEWPLPDVDARSAEEEARAAEALLRRREAEAAALALAEEHKFGKLLYEQRLLTRDWSRIAKVVGFPYRHSKKAAEAYARAYSLRWPIRVNQHACGAEAYRRRVELKEPWEVVAKAVRRSRDYVRRAAQAHAENSGLPWPVLLRDYGPEVYRLRYEEKLQWEEIAARCHISRAWAIREADRYKATLPKPRPSPNNTMDVDERAYVLRAMGKGWTEVRRILGCAQSIAVERAKRHAAATGKPWPIEIAPVRTNFSAQAKAAYERGHVVKEPWSTVAESLGYASEMAAMMAARRYADRRNLPMDIGRRRMLGRDGDRLQQAYERRAGNPKESWEAIGVALGYPGAPSAHTAARTWAKRNGLPWPLPGGRHG